MSRTGLFSAAALVVSVLATPAFCAAVDLSPVIAAEPALTAQGNPVDLTPVVNAAAQVSNTTIDAAKGAVAASPFAGAAPIDTGGLANAQGGTNIAIGAVTEQDLSAVNTGNSIVAGTITNGAINIPTGAFNGFNGVGNFVMNTGNQNNIQGTLSINVVIAPIPAP